MSAEWFYWALACIRVGNEEEQRAAEAASQKRGRR